MNPRLVTLAEKKLIGVKTTMSFATMHLTRSLWQSFMPRRNEIRNNVNTDLYSLELYPHNYFDSFNPSTLFEKWAAIEVADVSHIPDGMESIIIPSGRYAVFEHKGLSTDAPRTYQYIFSAWMPDSGFVTDDRPHMAVMGHGYSFNDPDAVEEIWIPVKPQ